MYEGKQNGFHNDMSPRYDEVAVKLARTARSNFSTNTCGYA
jgi:hypothetical protein